jgi:hypothetical protein
MAADRLAADVARGAADPVATARAKTAAGEAGPRDLTRADADDAAPGIGMDRETPLGTRRSTPTPNGPPEEERRFGRDDARRRR